MRGKVVTAGAVLALVGGASAGAVLALNPPPRTAIDPSMLVPTEVQAPIEPGLGELAKISTLSCGTQVTMVEIIDIDGATASAVDAQSAADESKSLQGLAAGATLVAGAQTENVAEFGVQANGATTVVAFAHRYENGNWAVDRITRCVGPEEIGR